MMKRLAIALLGAALLGCAADKRPAQLRLVNQSDKTMQCEVVRGTTSNEIRTGEKIIKVKLEPNQTVDYTAEPGRYTLFPSVWMFQGTKGLAFYPFRLKGGRLMTITLRGVQRPTFTGSTWALDYKASSAPQ